MSSERREEHPDLTCMWRLTNRLSGTVVYCASEPPMDNPFDGWDSTLWRLDPPIDNHSR